MPELPADTLFLTRPIKVGLLVERLVKADALVRIAVP